MPSIQKVFTRSCRVKQSIIFSTTRIDKCLMPLDQCIKYIYIHYTSLLNTDLFLFFLLWSLTIFFSSGDSLPSSFDNNNKKPICKYFQLYLIIIIIMLLLFYVFSITLVIIHAHYVVA